jgi:Cdc6-like AAA superfamily ATPase
LKELAAQVVFRESQLETLYDLLIREDRCLYPILHVYGLSGTGKTYTLKSFMNKFCNHNQINNRDKYYVYINCKEMCHSSMSLFFYEILNQVRDIYVRRNRCMSKIEIADNSGTEMENQINFQIQDSSGLNEDLDENEEDIGSAADCSLFVNQLKSILTKFASSKLCFYFLLDNADNLKLFKESNNLVLTLCKLEEFLNSTSWFDADETAAVVPFSLNVCTLFVTEVDWHSFISDCDLMSNTESPRPLTIFFSDYTKAQMYTILHKTAKQLLLAQYHALLVAKKTSSNSREKSKTGKIINVK